MYRPVFTIFLLVVLSLFWCFIRPAIAFTFRLGPVAEVDTTVPGTEASAPPTPQLFRIAIGQEGVIFGVTPPSEGFGTPEPEISLPEIVAPQSAQVSDGQAADRQLRPHRLSGVELLLLRDTQVVAEHAGE